jgi:hypothetical protein
VVVLVEGEDQSFSGACSALPVWGGQNRSATSIARKAGRESYLEFHGAIPWRESFSALFGERLAGCAILVMEHLAMDLGTAIQVDLDNCRAAGVDVAKAQATIDLLRLDSQRLRDLRKPVLDKLNEQLRRMVQSGRPLADARRLLAGVVVSKNGDQSWPPFLSAIRNYLGKSAELRLHAIGYLG